MLLAAVVSLAFPCVIGYANGWCGLATILLLAGFVWVIYDHHQALGLGWFYERRTGTVAVVLVLASLAAVGVVWGADAREEAQREAAQRAQQAAADDAARDAREAEETRRRTAEIQAETSRLVAERHAAEIEARRTPPDRAARALAVLTASGEAITRYCAAAPMLAPVPEVWKRAPNVRPAFQALRRAEREALRVQREENEDSRGLLCGDGELSPTCMCHGSHRGCCSWHGGVAGCEPRATEVYCPPAR